MSDEHKFQAMRMTSESHTSSTRLTFLGISGSLRRSSSNEMLLKVAARLAPAGVEVVLDPGVDALPYFNPDLDGEGADPPAPVASFRRRIKEADAVLISSPEYIHGVPGSLKNALDWTASAGVFIDKPVVLINASATSHHAQDSLLETLRVLMAEVSSVRIPLRSNRIGIEEIMADASIIGALGQVIASLISACANLRGEATEPSGNPTP